MRIVRIILVTFASLTAAGVVRGADKEEIIATCRDGYLQSRAAIRTLTCNVEDHRSAWRGLNPYTGKMMNFPATIMRLRWVEDRDIALGKMTLDPVVLDYLWDKGTLKELKTDEAENPKTHVGRIDGPEGITHVATAWGLALMDRPDYFRARVNAENVSEAISDTLEGQRCYRVTILTDGAREDVWFDIKKNFLLRQRIVYPHPGNIAVFHRYKVTQFSEDKPGAFFPASVHYEIMNNGKVDQSHKMLFRDVKINDPIDPAKLTLRFPTGTHVTDTRKGIAYTVDENEQPVGAVEHVAKSSERGSEVLMPTGLESRSYRTYWIVGGVVAAIAVSTAVYFRRRANRR